GSPRRSHKPAPRTSGLLQGQKRRLCWISSAPRKVLSPASGEREPTPHCRGGRGAVGRRSRRTRKMSDEREGSASGRPPGNRRRRPPPTIDGTASEVASEPMTNPTPETAAAPEPSPETVSSPGAAEQPARAEPDPAPVEAAASPSNEPPREPPPSPPPPRPSRGDSRPWIAAGIGGLIAVAVIIAALWLLNGYLSRDASLAGKVDALDAQVRGLAGKPAAADAKAVDDLRARVDVID